MLITTASAAIVTDAFPYGRVGLGLGVNMVAFAAGFEAGTHEPFLASFAVTVVAAAVSALRPKRHLLPMV